MSHLLVVFLFWFGFSFLTIIIDFYCAHHRVIPFFFSLSLSLKRNYFWVPVHSTADVLFFFFLTEIPCVILSTAVSGAVYRIRVSKGVVLCIKKQTGV